MSLVTIEPLRLTMITVEVFFLLTTPLNCGIMTTNNMRYRRSLDFLSGMISCLGSRACENSETPLGYCE